MTIEKDKLREMAKACGNFNWRFLQDKWTEYAIRDDHAYIANMRVGSPKHSGPCPEREAKAKFLGEMTPTTVLALLDEISALQHQVSAGKAREWDINNQYMTARESKIKTMLSNRALRAQRDELKAENEVLRKQNEELPKTIQAQLEAFLVEAKRDAERYRWITENADVDCRGHEMGREYGSLDECIDAAMAKEKGQ